MILKRILNFILKLLFLAWTLISLNLIYYSIEQPNVTHSQKYNVASLLWFLLMFFSGLIILYLNLNFKQLKKILIIIYLIIIALLGFSLV